MRARRLRSAVATPGEPRQSLLGEGARFHLLDARGETMAILAPPAVHGHPWSVAFL